jgi:hypothetical protein
MTSTSCPTTVEGPRIDRPADASACAGEPSYSIATLVTDRAQYQAMLASFRAFGFTNDVCEYLFIDNGGASQTEAYAGLNELLNAARAPNVILCHQDVRLIGDGKAALDARLSELFAADPNWAVAGNAGGVAPGRLALRITDPHGKDQNLGPFPARALSLDENFIVVRRDARIGFSRDLAGFHFYGADICLNADMAGYAAYVIDFHLEHLSGGRKAKDFYDAERAFTAKWSKALEPRWIQTTCSLVHLTGDPLRSSLGRVIDKPVARLLRRLPGGRGFKRPHSNPA